MQDPIYNLLKNDRLKEGLSQLEAIALHLKNTNASTEIRSMTDSYNFFLEYAKNGSEDPQRASFYKTLKEKAYHLYEMLTYEQNIEQGKMPFHALARETKENPLSIKQYHQILTSIITQETTDKLIKQYDSNFPKEELALAEKRTSIAKHIFDHIWVSSSWNTTAVLECEELMEDQLINIEERALFISALTLNLFTHFQEEKALLLLRVCLHAKENLLIERALIGLIFLIYRYEAYFRFYTSLKNGLEQIRDSKHLHKRMSEIFMQILLTRETQKVSETIQKDIIPNIMRNAQNLQAGNINFVSIEDALENMPDWDNSKSALNKSIERLSKMQADGVDTYMNTFAPLKKQSFFRETAHWLFPFSESNYYVQKVFMNFSEEDKKSIAPLLFAPLFCNSDKYSLCVLMNDLPSAQKEMLKKQYGSALALNKLSTITELNRENLENGKQVRKDYVQDLYRFFLLAKMQPMDEHMYLPWTSKDSDTIEYHFSWSPLLQEYFFNEASTIDILTYFINNKYYTEAIKLATYHIKRFEEEKSYNANFKTQMYEALGYSQEKIGEIKNAIDTYKAVQEIGAASLWLYYHLGKCYMKEGDYKKAFVIWQKYDEKNTKEDGLADFHIGKCLYIQKDYLKAIQCFHKSIYLGYKPIDSYKYLIKCYIVSRQYQKAIDIFGQLDTETLSMKDLIDKAHLTLLTQSMKDALPIYKEAYLRSISTDDFFRALYEDEFLSARVSADPLWKHLIDMLAS